MREVCGATSAHEPSGKTGNSRHCYVCSSYRSITHLYLYWISNAKIKKETDDRIWGKPATPNFHDHVTTIAPEANFIPYLGCVETLLPRAMYKTIYDCEKTPD